MNKSYILILDDEEHASSYLEELIIDIKFKNNFFSNYDIIISNNHNDFIEKLNIYNPDIIFLDIEMPINGIDVAKDIRDNYINYGYIEKFLPIIIFSTAFDNYGYKAFNVDAFDYILKPIDIDKLDYVFKKIEIQFFNHLKKYANYVKVSSIGLDVDLPITDVIYFKSDMKYTTVVTKNKEYLINDSLVSLEENFPSFIKIHRSYLINSSYINKFFKKDNNWYTQLNFNEIILPVSRRQKIEIDKTYNNFFK